MNSTREFRPEKISRTGEIITWVLAAVSMVALVFLWSQDATFSFWQIMFVVVMLLAAAGSTLSSWMDHNTVLNSNPDGISFKNGLRDVSMKWDEIHEVQVFPSRYGNRVNVFGRNSHFNFRTMIEETHKSGARSVMGFAQGEFILQQILKNSGLQETTENDKGRFYARP